MPETVQIPRLHDHHNHPSVYAAMVDCPSLAGLDRARALDLLGGLDPGRLTMVMSWHSALTPLAEDDLAGLPPVILANQSMHAFLPSPAARARLALDEPRLAQGLADQAWVERNLPEVLAGFSRATGLTPARFAAFMERLEAAGFASAEDMALTDEAALEVIRASRWAGSTRCWATPDRFQTLSPAARRQVDGLKFFADGAQGARTAGLSGPFLDGGWGLLLHTREELHRALGDAQGLGLPVAIHAIGDAAIGLVLDVLERLRRDGLGFPGIRMEHVQFMDEAQARRARDLGVTLSMQPNFSGESRDYADRLESRWLEANNPFRMLIDRVGFTPGRDLVFGTDGMPQGIEGAFQWGLFPLHPGQRLTLQELVAGFGGGQGNRGSSVLSIDPARQEARFLDSCP